MAGEVDGNNSRSRNISRIPHNTETEPPDRKELNFLANEAEFVGSGAIREVRSSTPKPGKHRRSRSRSGTRLTPSILSLSDETFYEDLEDYVKEMSTAKQTTMACTDDVWKQLQQKESDLLLAAELGKALLEKNEELKKEQEKVTEEYSKKLEVRFRIFLTS